MRASVCLGLGIAVAWMVLAHSTSAEPGSPQSYDSAPSTAEVGQSREIEVEPREELTDYDHRGTEQSPVIVTVLPTPDQRANEERDRQERRQDASSNWWLMVFTGAATVLTAGVASIAAIQVRLFFRQLHLMNESLASARKAADAAADSAKALMRAERAYVFAKVDLRTNVVGDAEHPSPVDVQFVNRGKTPAMLTRIRASFSIADEPPQELRAYPGSDQEIPPGLIIAADKGWQTFVYVRTTAAQMRQMEAGEKRLFVFGGIFYNDIHGTAQETCFCWHLQMSMGHQSLVITHDTKLNRYT